MGRMSDLDIHMREVFAELERCGIPCDLAYDLYIAERALKDIAEGAHDPVARARCALQIINQRPSSKQG
jgi:hypothetical protein